MKQILKCQEGRAMRCVATALVLSLCPALLGDHATAASESEIKSLRGVDAMDVIVENIDKDPPAGLTEQQVNTDVELKLRLAGIKVDESATPFLHVSMNHLRLESPDEYVYVITIGFNLWVEIPSVWEGMAETWSKGTVGITPGRGAADKFRDALGDLLDEFLNDYLTANPRER